MLYGRIPEPGTDDFKRAVQQGRWARELDADIQAPDWMPPERPTTLYDQLADGIPEIDYVVDDLMPSGVVQLNAQKKAGKTTLAMNIVRSMLIGEPLLGRFRVNTTEDDRIAYLNMELTKEQMLNWFADMQMTDAALKRLEVYHGREDGRLDFKNERVVEWIVTWLRDNGITVLGVDPLGMVYDASRWGVSDPNAAYLCWWAVLEEIVRQAKLRSVLIAHHSGFSEDAANRARGASAMMDKPDVNMTYRYNVGEGVYTDKPVDRKRYLSAFGRGVDVDEFEIDYNAANRVLTATGRGDRMTSDAERLAAEVHAEILRCAVGNIRPNKTDLFEKLAWSLTGRQKPKYEAGYELAKRLDYIRTEKVGNSILHDPGEGAPKRHFKLDNRAETSEENGT